MCIRDSPKIVDDPPVAGVGNTRGTISFANAGKDTRGTQCFINYGSNQYLDKKFFTPFGQIGESEMRSVVDRIYSGYEGKPDQGQVARTGNTYLDQQWPGLTKILKAEVVSEK